ncbi:MAG: winged helix-turn-helix domain-containing protein [Planctomycetes bacterium]|nr:winged helix-turn-helix domain-containing protein [Planctomycetota bacterium]
MLWITELIRRLIRYRFGVEHHHDHAGRILGELGMNCQMPAARAIELNPQEYVWRHIKRSTANHGQTRIEPLAQQVRRHTLALANSPQLLYACFKATPLSMRFPRKIVWPCSDQ